MRRGMCARLAVAFHNILDVSHCSMCYVLEAVIDERGYAGER